MYSMETDFVLLNKLNYQDRYNLEFISKVSSLCSGIDIHKNSLYTSMVTVNHPSPVSRPYTPYDISIDKEGFILVKYHIRIIDQGAMSKEWIHIQPQDEVKIKFIEIVFQNEFNKNKPSKVGIISGGTGFTTCWQWINRLKQQYEYIDAIFSFNSLNDVIIDPQDMQSIENYNSQVLSLGRNRIHLYSTVTNIKDSKEKLLWRGGSGFVSKDMIQIMLPSPSEATQIVLCGSIQLLQYFCGNNCIEQYKKRNYNSNVIDATNLHLDEDSLLKNLGYKDEQIVII